MDTTVYAFGGERLERVTAALDAHEVISQREVLSDGWWQRVPVYRRFVAFYRTRQVLRRECPVVLVDEFGFSHLLVMFLCQYYGCQFFSRIRGSMWNEYRDNTAYLGLWRRALRYRVDEVIRNTMLRRCDRILAVSYFNRMQVVYELHLDPARIDVVYEPCDADVFDEAPRGVFKREHGIPADDRLLLTVTNFNYREKVHGIEYFFPAIERLLRENPHWHYLIVGDGRFHEEFERRLFERCPADIANRISFTGFYTDIERAFADADLVLHPSFRDALPNAVIEAQVARKPVVVNSDGGMPESLPDDVRGYQVAHEPEAFFERAAAFVEDADLRRRVGSRNRAVADAVFSPAAVHRMFDRCLHDTIGFEPAQLPPAGAELSND